MSSRIFNNTYQILFGITSFCLSLLLIPYFTAGDQEQYARFYDLMNASPGVVEGFLSYNLILSSSEPVYFTLAYIFAPLVSKDILFSVLNGFFGYLFATWCNRNNVNKVVAFFAFYFNFYIYVLFFAAERLKLACILILFFSEIMKTNYARSILFSILAHFQTGILFISSFFSSFAKKKNVKTRNQFMSIARAMLYIIAGVLFFFLFQEVLIHKMAFYFQADNRNLVMDLLKPGFFILAAIIISPKGRRLEVFYFSIPILISAILFGSLRTTIFAYFVFMFFALLNKKGLNIFVLISTLYFGYHGIEFISRGIQYGDGFVFEMNNFNEI